MALDMNVINKANRWTTFEKTQVEKCTIDVTLVSRDVKHLEVQEESLSDYRLITMDLKEGTCQRTYRKNVGAWDLK